MEARSTAANKDIDSLKVWIIDKDRSAYAMLDRALRARKIQSRTFFELDSFIKALKQDEPPDVIIVDTEVSSPSRLLPDPGSQNALSRIPLIVTSAQSDLLEASTAYREGAFEYIGKPFDVDDVIALVLRASYFDEKGRGQESFKFSSVAKSPIMQKIIRRAGRLCNSSVTVLITGEFGTGKEYIARKIHGIGPHPDRPFIRLRPGSPALGMLDLVYSAKDKLSAGVNHGSIEGTIFIDEIADLSHQEQTDLLYSLSDRITNGAADGPRVIAASSKDIDSHLEKGSFRHDLFHLLNVVHIELPPLRERLEDIEELLYLYLIDAARKQNLIAKTITSEALEKLISYPWPGNIRELVNVCSYLTTLTPGNEIHLEDLPLRVRNHNSDTRADTNWSTPLDAWAIREAARGKRNLVHEAQSKLERVLIDAALKYSAGHRGKASELLGWGRNTLTYKIKNLSPNGLDEQSS